MTDIVERLRAVPETGCDPDLSFEAANRIERLEVAVKDLRYVVERKAAAHIKASAQMAHDIEWLMSCDYGDDTLRECAEKWEKAE